MQIWWINDNIFILVFSYYEEKNQNLINEGLKILHDTVKKLIDNPSSEDRYNFWSYININQIDRGEHKLEFGEMGFISGLFKLFDNNELYCLKIRKKIMCYSCSKIKEDIYYNKCLINLDNKALISKDMSQIINTKFLPSITTCECVNNSELMCSSVTYEIIKYPQFLFFILDIEYVNYFQYAQQLINLFVKNLKINNVEYKVRGVVCMPSELHYTRYILNNNYNYLNLNLGKTLFHDGKKNNGYILELEINLESILKNNICYIIIISLD